MAREVDLGKVHGDTPYIGEDGNWWIGDKDTGVAAGSMTNKPFYLRNVFTSGADAYTNLSISFSKINKIAPWLFENYDPSTDIIDISFTISQFPGRGSANSNDSIKATWSWTMPYRVPDGLNFILSDESYSDTTLSMHWKGRFCDTEDSAPDLINSDMFIRATLINNIKYQFCMCIKIIKDAYTDSIITAR